MSFQANKMFSYGHFYFSASCTGNCTFRHNLGIGLGPGNTRACHIREVLGEFRVTVCGANFFTINVANAPVIGEFRPTQQQDY